MQQFGVKIDVPSRDRQTGTMATITVNATGGKRPWLGGGHIQPAGLLCLCPSLLFSPCLSLWHVSLALSFFRSLAHAHTLYLSEYCLFLPACLSLSPSFFFRLSLSPPFFFRLSLCVLLSLSLSISAALCLSLFISLSLAISLVISLSLSPTPFLSLPFSLSLSLSPFLFPYFLPVIPPSYHVDVYASVMYHSASFFCYPKVIAMWWEPFKRSRRSCNRSVQAQQ